MSAGVTEEMVQAVAEVRLRHYSQEYDAGHLSWKDFADEAREILDAAFATQDCGATTDGAEFTGQPGRLTCIKRGPHKTHRSTEGATWST